MKIEVFCVGMFQENTYVVWDEESHKAFIIDPGGENERIFEFLKAKKLEVEAIINTHGHIDHIAGAGELKNKLKIPFRIHEGDQALVNESKSAARFFGVEVDEPPRIDGFLTDGETLHLGEMEIRVLHTPGHSPGGVCFLFGEGDVIVGDTLFAMSIGRTDLPGGSYDTLINSIKSKLLVLDDSVRVYPGHGPITTIGTERRANPFLS